MDEFMQLAIDEAKKGRSEGGIPIGSVLVKDGKVVATGITSGCRRTTPFCTARWTASTTPAASAPTATPSFTPL
nr:hypothetical protein [Pontibacter sp. BAB1700]